MTTTSDKDRVKFIRLVVTIQAIRTHLTSKGKMRLTRVATPANLRRIAAEFTGKTYARSRKGLEQALADLEEKKQALV